MENENVNVSFVKETDIVRTPEEVNTYLRSAISKSEYFKNLVVEGEISNWKMHTSSGHIYFSIKDKTSQLKCIIFNASANKQMFKNGDKVTVRGRMGLYVKSGEPSITVNDIESDGVGSLEMEFNILKDKLEKEGLFDERHKKQLPRFPKTIAVVTASTGAAVRDILSKLEARYPLAKVVIYDTLVQGIYSADSIVKNIKKADNANSDVIICGRGGGSKEDLWSFNEEKVARAIYNCQTPIVSAVGHEPDYSISDFVADVRGTTPTDAAQIVTPNIITLKRDLEGVQRELFSLFDYKKGQAKGRLDRSYISIKGLSERKTGVGQGRLDRTFASLKGSMSNITGRSKGRLDREYLQLSSLVRNKRDRGVSSLENLDYKLKDAVFDKIESKKSNLKYLSRELEIVNPLSILLRGYGLLNGEHGLVKSVNDVSESDTVDIQLADGLISVTVDEIHRD